MDTGLTYRQRASLFSRIGAVDLCALAAQVRAEVDLQVGQGGGAEERFKNTPYKVQREFRRQNHVRTTRRDRPKVDPKRRWAAIRKHNLSLAEPGELLLGDWLKEQCRQLRHDRSWVLHQLHRGKFPGVTLRKVNQRLIFVRVNPPSANGEGAA